MPTYLKQTDSFSCGPIALINVAKYYNFNLTKKDLSWIRKECNCVIGTSTARLYNVMKEQLGHEISIYALPVYAVSATCIRDWVSFDDKVVVFAYGWRERNKYGAHFVAIINYDKKSKKFIVANGHHAQYPNSPVLERWSVGTLANRISFSKHKCTTRLPVAFCVSAKPRTTKKRKQK